MTQTATLIVHTVVVVQVTMLGQRNVHFNTGSNFCLIIKLLSLYLVHKPQPTVLSSMGAAASSTAFVTGAGGFQPQVDVYGLPTQSAHLGTCKLPGCQFPRRFEGNKVHEFCSRTCTRRYAQMMSIPLGIKSNVIKYNNLLHTELWATPPSLGYILFLPTFKYNGCKYILLYRKQISVGKSILKQGMVSLNIQRDSVDSFHVSSSSGCGKVVEVIQLSARTHLMT